MIDVKQTIAEMSVEEKAALCSGKNFWYLKPVERLGIPSLMISDGPHGLRKQAGSGDHLGLNESVPATCFPTAVTLASSWDRELLFKVGEAIGKEARAEKVGVVLGPGANIKRSPLCGRNFEYFSEDPYLSGEMAKAHIQGVQSTGIGTSLKHYVANNQEELRMGINAIVDERALREIYLAGFEIAVKEAQPWTVMCAYNQLNDHFCSEHRRLMTDILKEEWGHQGIVVTDWGAMNGRVSGLQAGVELEMPGSGGSSDGALVRAVKAGTLDEEVLDQAAERLLTMMVRMWETVKQDTEYDQKAHHALARKAAAEGAVLLKNEEAILPLTTDAKIAVIGAFAKTPRYQGSGSSLINPTRLDNAYDELVAIAGADKVTYAAGYNIKSDLPDEALIQEAIRVACSADIALVFAGLTDVYEIEGLDRQHLRLPNNHSALINAVAHANPKTVVVLSNGSPVEMPWLKRVKGVLEGYLGGQAGAGAIADLLYGKVNPSGKLAETFPIKLEDNPSHKYFPGGPQTVEYRESIYVGYRYYDSAAAEILFPFGYGLSYTSFEYSNLRLSHPPINDKHDKQRVTVEVTVKNTGPLRGKEVVQLYVRDVESTIFRPQKELKGFAKVTLPPNEETTVTFELGKRAFAFYDVNSAAWRVESGTFEILIGASSQDIRLSDTVVVHSTRAEPALVRDPRLAAYYDISPNLDIPQAAFEVLCARPMPSNKPSQRGTFTTTTPISKMNESLFGKLLNTLLQHQAKKTVNEAEEGSPTAYMMQQLMNEVPLKTFVMLSQGGVSYDMVEGMVLIANGKPIKGIKALVKGNREK